MSKTNKIMKQKWDIKLLLLISAWFLFNYFCLQYYNSFYGNCLLFSPPQTLTDSTRTNLTHHLKS